MAAFGVRSAKMIRRPATILALLTALNLLNYLDRLVVSAVLPRVEAELDLTHFYGGLLATIFLLGYFVTSPLFGTLADRGARKKLIAFGVLVWSLATLASGLAIGAASLMIARAFVGVGEASYATLAPTIIDDVSPPEKKGRWLAIFYVASPVGAALGYLVGGFVEKRWGWRSAFFVAGGPGILLAFACLFIVEPARRLAREKVRLLESLSTLWNVLLYRRGVLGYCAYTFAVGGFSYWAPSFLNKTFKMELATANFRFGVITVVAGALGTAIGGAWSDRMQRRTTSVLERASLVTPESPSERRVVMGLLRICALGSLVGAPFAVVCFVAPTASVFFVAVFFCEMALFVATSPINAVILRSVPTEIRASAMALCIFAIHLLGDLWSPPFVGMLADHLPMTMAMMSLAVAIAVSSFLWWPVKSEA